MAAQGFDLVLVHSAGHAFDLALVHSVGHAFGLAGERTAEVVAGLLVDFGDQSVDKPAAWDHLDLPLLD